MTKAEVVKAVREYTKEQLKAQKLDLDGLNVSYLNDMIKGNLDGIIEECQDGGLYKLSYRE